MNKVYRGMPRRYLIGAPEEVRKGLIDIFRTDPPQPLDYDVIPRPHRWSQQVAVIDFGKHGERGQHSFLDPHQFDAFRRRRCRDRTAWSDLPEATQASILRYLEEE